MCPNCMPDIMILDPSSSGSPDILFTRLLYYTKCQSRKREIIQSNIHRILPNVNQVIQEPDIMILAQAVLQIFCSQCSTSLQCKSRKRVENGTYLCNDQSDGKETKYGSTNYGSVYFSCLFHMSHVMRKPVFDQSDQRLCFRCLDSDIYLLAISEISSL